MCDCEQDSTLFCFAVRGPRAASCTLSRWAARPPATHPSPRKRWTSSSRPRHRTTSLSPCRSEITQISVSGSVADPGFYTGNWPNFSIPDPNFSIPDLNFFRPGSEFFPSRISIKEFKYLTLKIVSNLSGGNYDTGSASRIRILIY